MIQKRFKNEKDEEKHFTTMYMRSKYGFKPNYDEKERIWPDCYFQYNDKYYAIEVTRYFHQCAEQKHQEHARNIQKHIDNNDLDSIYRRMGKEPSDVVTIPFYNCDDLKQFIINNINYIEHISIDNNDFLNSKECVYGEVPYVGKSEDNMLIEDFINYISPLIQKEKIVEISIPTKKKYNETIILRYCKNPYYGKDNNKKIVEGFCCFYNIEEAYQNIIDAIKKKRDKKINKYEEGLKQMNIKYDYYNLVIFYEGYPPSGIDEKELYERILNIGDMDYDEIAIFLWNKIMVVTKDGYDLYE